MNGRKTISIIVVLTMISGFIGAFAPLASAIPPKLVSITPSGSGVSINTVITVTFNQDMNQTSVENAVTFNHPLTGTYSWTGLTVATFTPDSPLNYSTSYIVFINSSMAMSNVGEYLDGNSNGVAEGSPVDDRMQFFTTQYNETAGILPEVISKWPSGNLTRINNYKIYTNFSQAMNTVATQTSFSILPNILSHFYWQNGDQTMVYSLDEALKYNTTYTITLNASSAQDRGGEFLDGNHNGTAEGAPVDNYVWNFTTVPASQPPRVIYHQPTGTNLSIWTTTVVGIGFDDFINVTSAQMAFNITPYVIGTFSWDDGMAYVFNETLAYNTTYTVTLSGNLTNGAKDVNGTYLDGDGDGISEGSPIDDYVWQFTTAPMNDTQPPKVSANIPTGINVPITQYIDIMFDEEMNLTSTVGSFKISPNVPGEMVANNDFSGHSSTLRYYPLVVLNLSTIYTVTLNGSIAKDLVDLTLDGNANGTADGSPIDDFVWSFTTEAVDARPPQISWGSPMWSIDVPLDTNITFEFDEFMNETSVTASFSIVPVTPGTFSYSQFHGRVAMTFDPTTNLLANTTYYVVLNSGLAKDVYGNTLDGNVNGISEGSPTDDYNGSFKTIVNSDPTPPTSTVNTSSPYWRITTPILIEATASDVGSGVVSVALYFKYRANNASSWSSYQLFGTNVTTAPYQWSFAWPNGNGIYEFYSIAMDNASNLEAATGAADAGWAYDTTAGTQTIDVIAPYWRSTSPCAISANPTEALSGVNNVALYYHFRASNASVWGVWTLFGTNDTLAPYQWGFNMPGGEGVYEFVTRVTDNVGNIEPIPASPEEDLGYDLNAPISNVTPGIDYWQNSTPYEINATAADSVSGILNVSLYYRYRANNASVWTSFLHFGVNDTVAPYQWNFTWPKGNGFYEFYTNATDNATNTESAPTTGDFRLGYDTLAPASEISSMNPYRRNTAPIVIQANVSGDLSGVIHLAMYYRFRATNLTAFNTWTLFGTNKTTAPYIWSFNWPNGQGVYEFYSRAVDNASNVEVAPVSADTGWIYDSVPPTVTTNFPVGTSVPLNAAISINFNESMNSNSIESAFSMSPTVSGSFNWNGNNFLFIPFSNLTNNLIYTITINASIAKDLAGNFLDGNANGTAEGSPKDDYSWFFTTQQDTIFPAPVDDLIAVTGTTNGAIVLNWTATGDDSTFGTASSYDVRYSMANITETNWQNATPVSGEPTPGVQGTVEQMIVTGLEAGETYYFAIKVVDDVSNPSPLSNIASTIARDLTAPAAPTDVTATALEDRIQIQWNAVADSDLHHYLIYRSTDNVTFEGIGNINADETSYLDLDVVEGTTYYYKLTAIDNEDNESPFSSTAKASLPIAIEDTPTTDYTIYIIVLVIVILGVLGALLYLKKGRKPEFQQKTQGDEKDKTTEETENNTDTLNTQENS